MLNLQKGHNESESVRDTVSLRYKVCFNSTTLKITTFVKGVWWCCGYWFTSFNLQDGFFTEVLSFILHLYWCSGCGPVKPETVVRPEHIEGYRMCPLYVLLLLFTFAHSWPSFTFASTFLANTQNLHLDCGCSFAFNFQFWVKALLSSHVVLFTFHVKAFEACGLNVDVDSWSLHSHKAQSYRENFGTFQKLNQVL